MADPTTTNKLLAVPTRGSDPGTWDSPVNGNSTAIDGMLGGFVAVNVGGGAHVNLTAPGSPSPGAGPTQVQNAIIRLTGALTAGVPSGIGITLPGYWIFENRTSNNASSFVQLASALVGGQEVIGLPPGASMVYMGSDNNVRFANIAPAGTLRMFFGVGTPLWIQACTVKPWLYCDGSTFDSSGVYAYLGELLLSNVLPDLRGRTIFGIDNGAGRLTSATFPGGDVPYSVGGGQTQVLLPANVPQLTTGTESVSHVHTFTGQSVPTTTGSGPTNLNLMQVLGTTTTSTASVQHTHTVGQFSPTAFGVVPPAMITGNWFIATGV